HRAGGHLAVTSLHRTAVPDGPPAHVDDAKRYVELFLEAQRTVKIERRRDSRPPDLVGGAEDAQSRLTPERMLGLFHVSVEPRKVDESGDVGLVELHAAPEPIFSGHESVLSNTPHQDTKVTKKINHISSSRASCLRGNSSS